MHAFLFIGKNINLLNSEIRKKTQKLKSKILEFPVSGIENIREINKFSRLTLSKSSIILIRDVDKLSSDAVNAFLKTLEEPQANLVYFLTATSIYNVLPTITSRSQIIKVGGYEELPYKTQEFYGQFLAMDVPSRFAQLDTIKSREAAILFLQDFLKALQRLIHQKGGKMRLMAKAAEEAQKTLNALEQNGNTNLQLTNFAINF